MHFDNITLISEEYPPFMFGGIGSVCYDLAFTLSKRRIPTTVLCGRSKTRNIEIEEPNKNLRIVRLPFFDFPPRFFWFQIQNTQVFRELIEDTAVVHVVNPQAGAIGVYFKKRFNKPLVTSIHGVPLVESKVFFNSPVVSWTRGDFSYNLVEYPLNDFSTRYCLANSECIAVCSATTAWEIESVYSSLKLPDISVIYNGVNFDKIDQVTPDSTQNRKKQVTILYYGRLYYRKGILEALKAVKSLSQSSTGFRFEIFGKGPLEKSIKNLVVKWHLEEIVHLRGHVPYENLIREVKMSDIVLAPSFYEAQSVSILEAMACGKPVVAYDFSFSREIIENMRNGILARPGNVKDLSNKIRLLLQDEGLRIRVGKNAYEYVKKNHDWSKLAEKYVELYYEAIKKSSS